MVNRNSTKWVGGKKKKRKTERKGFILECNKTLDFFPPFIWRLQECNFQIRLQTSIYLISRYLLSLYVSIFLRKKKKESHRENLQLFSPKKQKIQQEILSEKKRYQKRHYKRPRVCLLGSAKWWWWSLRMLQLLFCCLPSSHHFGESLVIGTYSSFAIISEQ